MIRINLLPHRQLRREAKQRQFGLMAAFAAAAAIALVFTAYTIIITKIESQAERNGRLTSAIAKLDNEIADIKELKNQIGALLERKQVVENLQTMFLLYFELQIPVQPNPIRCSCSGSTIVPGCLLS
jgi:type IV pilus assembly protein PilN